ncbi:MAG: hypothetical protein FWC57_00150 [Endomicrobia bacterium]|nr:hypothetical protein [Endomicrobiia bacterium]
MKKITPFVLFLFCVFASGAVAENTRKVISSGYSEGNPKKEVAYYGNSGKEVAREYYHIDGRVMGVKGSIPDGEILEYYPDGAVKSKALYRSNLMVEETEYCDDGAKKSRTLNEWSGRNLVKTGNIIYYPDGSVQREITMDGDGIGTSRVYYKTGELFEESSMENACRSGPATQYYKSGKKKLTGFMKDDALDGPAKEYGENGNVIEKSIYKNGKKTEKL